MKQINTYMIPNNFKEQDFLVIVFLMLKLQ